MSLKTYSSAFSKFLIFLLSTFPFIMGKVNTQLINAYLAYFFQPEYKNIFTDELLVSGSELLCFGEIPEKNDKKNGINNAEQSEINILSPFEK